ncbi:helix-turn-helix domain-containing protein [Pseudonocardia sp. NPDC049635]|uniref:sigma-54-dependent Fis family transcriptional regulator n=1 Tax=Pseudonocardia sp. NPDC049635 TaxID=3155506 RepID=UPI0033CF8EBB
MTPHEPRWGPRSRRRTEVAREFLLRSTRAISELPAAPEVRGEITSSWRRSQLSGLDPDRSPLLPHDPAREGHPRLVHAATPVLERLSAHLDNTAISLADSSSWLLWRRAADRRLLTGLDRIQAAPGSLLAEDVAGTNGLGTVLEVGRPVMVAGPEHFFDGMGDFTCVGVPVRDPLNGRLEGVVALTCHYRDTNEHLLPLVIDAAREIEDRLRNSTSSTERALFDAFLRSSRSPAIAVASMNDEYLFTNARAAQLFEPSDHARLWHWAQDALRSGRSLNRTVTLSGGEDLDVRCSPVTDGTGPAGVLLTMRPSRAGAASARSSTVGSTSMPAWDQAVEAGCRLARAWRRIAVTGGPGAGKATLARAIHAAALGDTTLVELDLAADGLQRFACDRGDTSTTFLIRHVDGLRRHESLELATLVERAQAHVLLAVDPASVDPTLRSRLLDRTDGEVAIPSLRDRRQDLPGLTETLLRDLGPTGRGRPPRCSSEALMALMSHDLPGNTAELRRVLATALAAGTGRDITVDDLPPSHRTVSRQGRRLIALEEAERATVRAALETSNWNAERAAASLGISRATIYRKMRVLAIRRPLHR